MSKLIDVRANVHIFEDNRFDFSYIIDLYFNINNTILHFYCGYDGETLVMDNVFSKNCTNMGEYGNIEHINLTTHPIFNTVIGRKISNCHLIKSTHRLCGIIINLDNQHRVIIANLGDDFFVGNELPSLFNGGDYTIELCNTLDIHSQHRLSQSCLMVRCTHLTGLQPLFLLIMFMWLKSRILCL